jgi:hypothetical protein
MQLFRPVGLHELRLIAESGFLSFPPRLPEQPIFYPVTSLGYARQIASEWNTKTEPFAGFVTSFEVDDAVAARYPVQTVGSQDHRELWIPAEDLGPFNEAIRSPIRVLEAYLGSDARLEIDPRSNLPADWTYRVVYELKSAEETIRSYSESDGRRISFAWNGQHGEHFADANADFRNQVLGLVVDDLQVAPDMLVRDLFLAVTKCSKEAWSIDIRASVLARTLLCRNPEKFLQDYMQGASQSFDAGMATGAVDLPAEVVSMCLELLADELDDIADERERHRLSFFQARFLAMLDQGRGGPK